MVEPAESRGKVISPEHVTSSSSGVARKVGLAAGKNSKSRPKSEPNAAELKRDEARCNPPAKLVLEQPCRPVVPKDEPLQTLIKAVLNELKMARTIREEIGVIAATVARQMGGHEVTTGDTVERHIRDLCREKRSNCLALGEIRCGTFMHRALLFKTIADRIHLPVSLHRGRDAARGWNEVHLPADDGVDQCSLCRGFNVAGERNQPVNLN